MPPRKLRCAIALPALLLSIAPLVAASAGADSAPATFVIADSVTAADSTGSGAALAAAAEAAGLRTSVLELALRAHARVRNEGRTTSDLLTVIDYSLPSRERRLWVLDLATGAVLEHELVAHGNGSGGDLATAFSNVSGSNQTSLGTFVTGATYQGKHGLSLRLHGLDEGLNDQAHARAIVVHGADYVNPGIVSALGRLGRSQGCPALATAAAGRIIERIQGGTVVFSYYPTPALERTLAGTPVGTLAL